MSYDKEKRKQYLDANKKRISEKKKEYYDNNRTIQLQRQKNWQDKNKDKLRVYYKQKRSNDPIFKLKGNIKNLIKNSINKQFKKQSKTEQILGCTIDEFKLYIESKFQPWMNWENYGLYNGTENYGWDIDHITPLAMAETVEDIIRLNYYTNLQPLCSHYNRNIKKDNIV